MLSRRRSAIDIVHDVLNVCGEGDVNKTAIMYRCNLSYYQLKQYIALLSEREMIVKTEGGRFTITSSGQRILHKASKVRQSILNLSQDLDLAAASG